MFTYTFGDRTLYAKGDMLFEPREETHRVEELDGSSRYLYNDDVVTVLAVSPFTVHVRALDADGDGQYIPRDEFGEAVPLDAVVPEEILECPECGGWAGEQREKSRGFCFECGWREKQ